MRMVRPSRRGGIAVNSGSSRDRTARPIREKPGTTQASSAASTAGPKLVTARPPAALPPRLTGPVCPVASWCPGPGGRPDRAWSSPAAARSATPRKPGRRMGSSTRSGPRSRTSAS